VHEVIGVSETGEVPAMPLAEGETERKPLEWCKQGETYLQKIK